MPRDPSTYRSARKAAIKDAGGAWRNVAPLKNTKSGMVMRLTETQQKRLMALEPVKDGKPK